MKKLDRKLSEFLDYVTDGMGRPEERRRALSWYLAGLLLEGGRETHVAMAGRPATVDAPDGPQADSAATAGAHRLLPDGSSVAVVEGARVGPIPTYRGDRQRRIAAAGARMKKS